MTKENIEVARRFPPGKQRQSSWRLSPSKKRHKAWRLDAGYEAVFYLGVSKKAGNVADLGVSSLASLAVEQKEPDGASSGVGASAETPKPLALLTWSATRATSASLLWAGTLVGSAFLLWAGTLASSAFYLGKKRRRLYLAKRVRS